MAWIKHIEVSGLAGNPHKLSLKFDRRLNVMWGPNGCGKTSLLKILHSALTNDASSLVRVPFQRAYVVIGTDIREVHRWIDREQPEATTESDGELRLEESPGDEATYAASVIEDSRRLRWRQDGNSARNSSFAHRYLPVSRVSVDPRYRNYYPVDVANSSTIDEAMLDRIYASELQNTWRNYTLRQTSRVSDIQRNGIATILKAIVEEPTASKEVDSPRIGPEEANALVKEFFRSQRIPTNIGTRKEFFAAYETSGLLQRVVNDISDIQAEIRQAETPARRIEEIIRELFYGDKNLKLERPRMGVTAKDHDVPLESLSSGEKQVLRLLIEALAAGTSSILVDEPELSMHVDWQNRLLEDMQAVNPDAQIVAATHSPEIMARIEDDNIFEVVPA